MSWDVIRLQGGLGEHRAQWDRLNARVYGDHPLFSSKFVDPLLRHFGTGAEFLCVQGAHGREPDGMLILTPGGKGRWSSFLPDQAQLAPVLMESARTLNGLFGALPGVCWTIELLCQDPLYCPAGSFESELHHDHALTMNIAVEGGFEEYWQQRPKKLVQNVRRYRKRALEDAQHCAMHMVESPADMQEAVLRYAALESAGWKGTEGTAVGPDNKQGRFFLEVMQAFAQEGKATTYEFFVGERLAASRLMIRNDQMLVALKTTYDETLAQLAPGRLLLHDLLACEFERQRVKAIEFYTNATVDQLAWSTASRNIRHTNAFRNRFIGASYVVFKRLEQQRRKSSD